MVKDRFSSVGRAVAGLWTRPRGRRIWGLAGIGLLVLGLLVSARLGPSEMRRGGLGASVYAVNARIAERAGMEAPAGVFVISVLDGYAAQEAGLKLGDILLSVDGVAVASQGEFEAALRKIKPGAEVFLTRLGGEGPEEVAVRLQGSGTRRASEASDEVAETGTSGEPGRLAAAEMHYARRLGLQFQEGAELWEMGAWDHPCLRSYLVPRDGVPVFLDGRAATVHGIAAQSAPDLGTEAQAAQYLRYYNGHIWAKAGAFKVIEWASDLPGGEGAAVAQPGPVRIEGRGETMEAEAVVLYAGQLFRARYAFGAGGRIKMLSDEKLGKISASDTVFRAGQRCATDGQSREATGYPVPPAMAGEWENVAGPEFYEVRQLILMGEG